MGEGAIASAARFSWNACGGNPSAVNFPPYSHQSWFSPEKTNFDAKGVRRRMEFWWAVAALGCAVRAVRARGWCGGAQRC